MGVTGVPSPRSLLTAGFGVLLLVTIVRASPAPIRADQAKPRTTRDKVYSKEQAAAGEKQYLKLCAHCHDPEKVPTGKKPGPPLSGDKFFDKWADHTLGDLQDTIQSTMPNDGSAVLNERETADVIAYMLKVMGFPDGPSPLAGGAASKDIVIVR